MAANTVLLNKMLPGLDSALLTAGTDSTGEILEEEPAISVVFWSITFVLLLIVTIWFYITQILPAHASKAHRSGPQLEDKAEQVAKRILEQLQVTESTEEAFPGEKRPDCQASSERELETVYEYVDDEIHIHYSKRSWESHSERMDERVVTRRRQSMDEMELIFPGFLPIIKEEEEEEDALEECTGKELLIDSFQQNSQRKRAPADIENKWAREKRQEKTAKKTAVVKPGSHQVTTTKYSTKDDVVPHLEEPNEGTAFIKPVEQQWRLEPVNTGITELNSLGEDYSHLGTGVKQIDLEGWIKPAVHASLEKDGGPRASRAGESALDVEIVTSARNAIPPQGLSKAKRGEEESIAVFTLQTIESSPDSEEMSEDYLPSPNLEAITTEQVDAPTSGHSSADITSTKDLSSAKHSDYEPHLMGAGERQTRDGKALEDSQGLKKDNGTEIDYACEVNGITNGHPDEPETKGAPTSHAWTFFSMTETSEMLGSEVPPLGRETIGNRSLAKAEVPSIIVDSYDDARAGEDNQGRMHAAAEAEEPAPASSFETDIDVDEIDIDEAEFEDEGEFGLYFKRHVSVTDLDKILAGENSVDGNGLETEGDDITLTNGDKPDDITSDPYQNGDAAPTDERDDIAVEFDLHNHKRPINTRNSDKESVFSQPEQDQQNASHIEEGEIKSSSDNAAVQSEPAASVTTFRLDQLIEQSPASRDLEDDNLETFCEELSDLIEECKKERRPRLFTIPEEVEVAQGIFVDRALQRGGGDKAPRVVEAKSDSAPIATEEFSDLDFDLEEVDEGREKVELGVNVTETLELESLPDRAENVTTKDGEIPENLPQATDSKRIEDHLYTEQYQKETCTPKEANIQRVSGGSQDGVAEIAPRAVTAGATCDENENYSSVSHGYAKLESVQAPSLELVETKVEQVLSVNADSFFEENCHITEFPEVEPALSVSASAPSWHQVAKTEEELIKHEDVCRFQEVKANASRAGFAESTTKREKGLRITRVTVVKRRVKNDSDVSSPVAVKSADSRPELLPVEQTTADALPVTKVTVQEVTNQQPPAGKPNTDMLPNRGESRAKKVGLKIVVTGRRTGSQNDLSRGGLPQEGRASPDRERTSSLRSSPTPLAGRPPSAHRIGLSRSHEDLSLAGPYKRNDPQRVVVKERILREEEPGTGSAASAPSPPPAIPEDGAIESFQAPKIHKTKITVSETVGNKTVVTILNVQKRVTGSARWKSLNDLDSFGSPLPPTIEASRMSWSGEESSARGAETASSSLNNQKLGRGESGYGSLDFERKTPSPPTGIATQHKETIFAVSAEPVAMRKIASIEEETEGSSTDTGDQFLGESTVQVTDLDSALLLAHTTPQPEDGDLERIYAPCKIDREPEVPDSEDDSCHLVAYAIPAEAVPLEAVVLPTKTETQEDAPVITAFPVNDGYEDDELDDVFYDNRSPVRDSGIDVSPRYGDNVQDFHSSDADSETSSVHSVTLKHRHLHTRASLEASSPRIPRLSDSTDSSHTATPIADLENDSFECFSQHSSIPNGKPLPGQSGETTPRNRLSRSTTEIDTESANIGSAFIRVGNSRPHDAELSARSLAGYPKARGSPDRDYEQPLTRDLADSRKSMPDLSGRPVGMDDSPYLRGLSAHTKRWLSQNFMSPTTFPEEDDMLGSEMFLHPTSFINLADDDDGASIASVSTRPQSPMSEFSFAGEVPHACPTRDARTVVRCAYTRCGREEVLLGRQKTTFTSCPACFTYYCNRDCRRVHWSEHKKVCFFGRINSYVRSFVYHTEKRENLKFMLSKVASDGYKKNGRGCVMVVFGSPQAARKFMTTGCTFFPSPPSYSSYAKVKTEGVISRHKEVLLQLIKDHDPAQEFVLNLAIIAGKMENLPPEPVPRRKVNTVLQCVKIPLSERLVDSSPNGLDPRSPETKVFHLPKCSRHEFVNEAEARRHYCRNISKEMKHYGIKLKKDYPEVYDKLCQYVEKGRPFEVQSMLGNRAGRQVTCKIMPEF